MGQGLHGCGANDLGVHGRLQGELHETQPVGLVDLPPALPPQHAGPLQQGDATDGGVETGVEESRGASSQHLQRVGRCLQRAHQLLDQALLDVLVDGLEQVALVAEVVIQSAPGQARRAHQFFRRGVGEAPLGEQDATRGDEGGPGPFRLLRFGWHAYCLYVLE